MANGNAQLILKTLRTRSWLFARSFDPSDVNWIFESSDSPSVKNEYFRKVLEGVRKTFGPDCVIWSVYPSCRTYWKLAYFSRKSL